MSPCPTGVSAGRGVAAVVITLTVALLGSACSDSSRELALE
jgi:hypothetical protein